MEWQVEGTLVARVDVKPKITALVYDAAGLWADLDPYLEVRGSAQLNPWQYQWGLYGGLDAHLGSDLTVFDWLFPNLSFELPFTLIPETRITGDDNLTKVPKILLNPQGRTVKVGDTVSFTVKAEGTGPFSYQWQRNGADLSSGGRIGGAQGSVLRISNVQYADAGNYRVWVGNSAGTVASSEARLVVGSGGVNPDPGPLAYIPAGNFQMGDTFGEGWSDELPVHTVYVSAFYMDRTEVTKAQWDEVYQWAIGHGYGFDYAGSGKAADHPVQTISWYDAVKWCNARSEREGRAWAYYTDSGLSQPYRTGRIAPYVRWDRGYRLPTEAEWEKAARGGLSGKRFPWGDTITHSLANYYSSTSYSYDTSSTRGYHPTYATGDYPYTSPVGSFAANGYGLYDMAGNVWEWCWDLWSESYYSSSPSSDPRGSSSGSIRVLRGGSWYYYAWYCRAAYRNDDTPDYRGNGLGFRAVLPPGQP